MRVFTILPFLIFLLNQYSLQSQTAQFKFEKTDVRPGYIAAQRQYNDSSLWGYHNGGADLFLEYGFKQLTHQEIVFRSLLVKADIYEMTDSAAAFGLFSISAFKCKERDVLNTFDCIDPKQLQFAAGKYYVSITNIRGDSTAYHSTLELAGRLLKKQDFKLYEPPPLFQSALLAGYQNDLKVIFGPLGLQNAYPDWSELFEGADSFYMTLLANTDSVGSILVSRIIFTKPEDMKSFRERSGFQERVNNAFWKHKAGDTMKVLIKLDDVSSLYLETRGNHKIAADLKSAFEKVGQMAGSKN
ncbi:MAG: DUF6599 family protein [Bacteroidales bacterium]